ncbi:aldehyde dehydrogenase family protein [Nocardioides pelophilus]|uniref:aldehyde dehydrogenase family protein n=1 Tax=Nocardioides pelophilus TaxID=2172019 RepID=UPI001C7EAC56|nr:aldehyde dehydrogenase family protein [Nocardioides pelophilus]
MANIEVTSPWDGSRVGEVPATDPRTVPVVAERLRAEQPAWARTPATDRAAWVSRLRDQVLADVDSFVETLSRETGKPQAEARVEVLFATEAMRHLAARSPRYLAQRPVRSLTTALGVERATVTPAPYPLVGVISPWNFPFGLAVVDAVPALLAGASVLMKPSDLTPLSATGLVAAWRAIGAPDVLDVVVGDAPTGVAVVDTVDFVAFTGSTGTGRAVGRRAAERLVPVSLELGGNDAMIVLADANLDHAANAAVFGAMCNGGQMCVSTERVYVEDSVHDRFVDLVRDRLRDLGQRDITPLASAAQLEVVRRQVVDAERKGAKVERWHDLSSSGTWFPPTLVLDATDDMDCVREETFGPVMPVLRVGSADEAVERANLSPYGLSATVWTTDPFRAQDVADRLEVGAVNVNCVFSNLFFFDAPQQGWKSSGLGARFGGAHAVRRYCRDRVVLHSRHRLRAEPHWLPYSSRTNRLLGTALGVLRHGAVRRLRRRGSVRT